MTNLNEKKARLESLRNSIAFVSRQISDYQNAVVRTKIYVYAGFTFDPDTGSIYFLRDGIKFRYIPAVGRYTVKLVDTHAYDVAPVVNRLPVDVVSVLDKLPSACRHLDALTAEHDQLEAEIAALESEELPPPPAHIYIDPNAPVVGAAPVRKTVKLVIKKDAPMVECPLNETAVSYDYADTISNTLAERVEAREVIEAAEPDILDNGAAMFVGDEAGAFAHALNICGISYVETGEGSTPAIYIENFEATMEAVDADLIDDINASLFDIDASDVNALLEHAERLEGWGRKAKAAGYRQVALLAALYAVDDAIERAPELEGLMVALYDWHEPAQLPPNVAAGIATAKDYAKRMLDTGLLSAGSLDERTRAEGISGWAMDVELFRGMDDDTVAAFSLHPTCGVWISFFNQLWVFESDHAVDASAGSFESEMGEFTETLSRFLGPDAEDLY